MELKRWPSFLALTFMLSFRAFAFAQELSDKPDVPALDEPVAGGAIVTDDVREEDDKSVSGEPSPTVNLDDLLRPQETGQIHPLADLPKFMIGVSLAEVPASLRAHISLEDKQGIMVGRVLPDSPAAKAGLQQYDIILGSGDKKLSHPKELQNLVDEAGEKPVTVAVQRRGELKTLEITPVKREALIVSEEFQPQPGLPVGASLGAFTNPTQILKLADGRTLLWTIPSSQPELATASVNAGQIHSLTQSIQALTQQMEQLQQAIDRLEKKPQASGDDSPSKAVEDAP